MSDGNPIAALKDTQTDITRKASVVVHILEQALNEVPLAQIGGPHLKSILTAHGWPHVKQMRDHIEQLRPLGDLPVTFDTPTTAKEPAMTEREIAGPIERLLIDAERHDSPKIVKRAERIRTLLDDLKTAIEADREAAKKRAKIAALEAELAALKGSPRKAERSERLTRGEYPCRVDGCDTVTDTAQGRAAHERMAHDFNIKNAQAAS